MISESWLPLVAGQLHSGIVSARVLSRTTYEQRQRALLAIADALGAARPAVLAANLVDVDLGRQTRLSAAKVDRLLLTSSRYNALIETARAVAQLPDPLGRVLQAWRLESGVDMQKVTVPLGLIAVIYESRPNVTVDTAVLGLLSGNAVLLRGGKESLHTNRALTRAIQAGLRAAGLPETAVQLMAAQDYTALSYLLRRRDAIALVIPRGGADLIDYVTRETTIPVIETGVGNCHLYVHDAADIDKAVSIALNAKCQRPSVCNAIETILVDESAAVPFLDALLPPFERAGVTVHGCPRTAAIAAAAGRMPITAAGEDDYGREYLSLDVAVRVVTGLEMALSHIARYGTRHSEAIVTEDATAAQRFLTEVDAACVYHNASTRFTDGFAFGFGAEIGISTQKLHARGPMGLEALTSTKYIGSGTGQVREIG